MMTIHRIHGGQLRALLNNEREIKYSNLSNLHTHTRRERAGCVDNGLLSGASVLSEFNVETDPSFPSHTPPETESPPVSQNTAFITAVSLTLYFEE